MDVNTRGLRSVGVGLVFVIAGVLLKAFVLFVNRILPPLLDVQTIQHIVPFLALGANAISLAGEIRCLSVPVESRAKGIVLSVVGCDVIACLLSLSVGLGVQFRYSGAIVTFLSICTLVLFIVFLLRLGHYLDHFNVADQAGNLLASAGFNIGLFVIAVLANNFGAGGVLLAMGLSLVIAVWSAVVFFQYVQTIAWLRSLINDRLMEYADPVSDEPDA
jgi:hypothetical protein